MHHVALDRPRAHDGDLDHEIVEFAGAQPRQHVHLRTALNLEYAQRIPLAQHGIGFRVLARDAGKAERAIVVIVEQVEAFADAGQHAQREDIDLEDAERLDIVLVPFDETAFGHRPIADRHGFGQRAFGEDEPADMLRQMPWHANHLLGQFKNPAQVWIAHIHARLGSVFLADLAAPSAPYGLGQRSGDILGQPHRLAHFADRHARAVMDHRGAQAGAVAAVFAIDVLDHLFAPLMLEIDIDIGRLLAFFRNETVEQQRVLGRIDAGDAETIADRRIGRAAAPLAQDRRIDPARIIDDILDGEEVSRQVELADQRQFAFDRFAHGLGHAAGIAPGGPFPRFAGEILLRRLPVGVYFLGIFIRQFVETEIAGIGHFARGGNRMRPAFEQPDHGRGRLEIAFAIAFQQVPRRRDGGLVADRGHHVLQRAPVGRGVMHVIGGEDAKAMRPGERIEPFDPRDIAVGIEEACGKVAKGGKLGRDMRQDIGQRSFHPHPIRLPAFGCLCPGAGRKGDDIVRHRHGKALVEIARGQQDQLHIPGMPGQHRQADVAGALGLPFPVERAHPSSRDQAAQLAIAGAIPRISQEGKTFDSFYPATDKRLQFKRFCLGMNAHHARHRIGIGNPDRIVTQRPRLQHQVDRIRRPAQEAEAGHESEFDEGRTRRRLDARGIELDRPLGDLEIVFGHDGQVSPSFLRRQGSIHLRRWAKAWLDPRLHGGDERS